MTDLPTEAVEAAARTLCVLDGCNPDDRAVEWVDGHWTNAVSAPAWTDYVDDARAALTAAAPHITDAVRRELLADTYTAKGGEIVMRELGRAKAELADLLAWIRALRDEWRAEAATAECNGHALDRKHMYDGARAERLYAMTMQRHADALDALLPERAR